LCAPGNKKPGGIRGPAPGKRIKQMTVIHLPPHDRNEELTLAQRKIADASLKAFRHECNRIGSLAGLGKIDRHEAFDGMLTAAHRHGLPASYGSNFIGSIIAEGFTRGRR
jgi:hypothetical protein